MGRTILPSSPMVPTRVLQVAIVIFLLFGSRFAKDPKKDEGHFSSSSSDSSPGRTIAVVYTDIKFDDKMAIHVLLSYPTLAEPKYDLVVCVINSIADMEKANGELRDFLKRMGSGVRRLVVVKGSNEVFNIPSPHESTYFANRVPIAMQYPDAIPELFTARDILDLYQIGPTPRRHIEAMVNQPIRMFYMMAGYNSRQAPNNDPLTLAWLQEIQQTLGENRPVLFTTNRQSFDPPLSGSALLYTDLKGRVATKHLEAALRDPYHKMRFEEIMGALNRSNVHLPLVPRGYERKDIIDLIVLARKDDSKTGKMLRRHFLDLVNLALPYVEADTVLSPYAKGRIRDVIKPAFSTEPMTVETCDANHVIMVLTVDPNQYQPTVFILDQYIKFAPPQPGQAPQGMTLYGLKKEDVVRELQPYLLKRKSQIGQLAACVFPCLEA